MKTTLEIQDPLFRKAKSIAAERGLSLKDFITEALQDKLALNPGRTAASDPGWMQGFGKLKRLAEITDARCGRDRTSASSSSSTLLV